MNRTMKNKILFFVDTKKKKHIKSKKLFFLFKEYPFLHIISTIQDGMPVSTYFIKLSGGRKSMFSAKNRLRWEE